jgi:hypothetical protein
MDRKFELKILLGATAALQLQFRSGLPSSRSSRRSSRSRRSRRSRSCSGKKGTTGRYSSSLQRGSPNDAGSFFSKLKAPHNKKMNKNSVQFTKLFQGVELLLWLVAAAQAII